MFYIGCKRQHTLNRYLCYPPAMHPCTYFYCSGGCVHGQLSYGLGYTNLLCFEHRGNRTHKVCPRHWRIVRCNRWHHNCRSEEHTSELQSRGHLVCRLLLEKK